MLYECLVQYLALCVAGCHPLTGHASVVIRQSHICLFLWCWRVHFQVDCIHHLYICACLLWCGSHNAWTIILPPENYRQPIWCVYVCGCFAIIVAPQCSVHVPDVNTCTRACACMHRGWYIWDAIGYMVRHRLREICVERLWDGCHIVDKCHTHRWLHQKPFILVANKVPIKARYNTHIWQHGNAYTIK